MQLPLDIPVIDSNVHVYQQAEVGRRAQMGMGKTNIKYDGTPEDFLELLAQVSTNKASGGIMKNFTPTAEMAQAAWAKAATPKTQYSPETAAHPNKQAEERVMYDNVRDMIAARLRRRNAWGNEVSKKYPNLWNFIGIDPHFLTPEENVEELELRVKEGAKGVKMHPTRNLFHPADRRLWPFYKRAEDMDVPIFTHSGAMSYSNAFLGLNGRPTDYKEVLDSFPRLRIVMLHLGWGYFDEVIQIADDYPIVKFTSTDIIEGTETPHRFSDEELVELVRRVGAERIIFGTDWVFNDFAPNVERLALLPLTDNEKELIFYRNAQELLGI